MPLWDHGYSEGFGMPESDYRQDSWAAVIGVTVTSAVSEMGAGAVQNSSSRENVACVHSASIAAVSLLLADELDEVNQFSLNITGEQPPWAWSLETYCR